jgi:hypothetical protein
MVLELLEHPFSRSVYCALVSFDPWQGHSHVVRGKIASSALQFPTSIISRRVRLVRKVILALQVHKVLPELLVQLAP